MIIGIEGLSTAGKTKFIDKFLEKYPDTIRFRGAGAVNIGMGTRWQDYNFWMHNIIEQLDKLNKHQPLILWDRFLTDCVHNTDLIYSEEILRVMKSHKKKLVIYIDVPPEVLKERKTKEGDQLTEHSKKYESVIRSFNHLRIKPAETDKYYITDAHIDQAYKFIMDNK